MPSPPASQFSAVHPFQIEVQDFDSYALIVDARPACAFEDDHIPGAVNVPPGIAIGGAGASELPAMLQCAAARLRSGDTILVYCDRGGLDAQACAEPLRRAGWSVDVLPGGWGNYRRWVDAGLEVLPRGLAFRRLVAPPMCGLCAIVPLLREQGEQVLDLPELVGQRLIPGLSLPGDVVPTQGAFETRLLDVLRRFDAERVVWVRTGSELPAGLAMPPALQESLARAESIRIEVPIDQRARVWFDRIRSLSLPVEDLLRLLLRRAGTEQARGLEGWMAMLGDGRATEALSEVIGDCIDPACTVEVPTATVLRVPSLEPEPLVRQVCDLVRGHHAGHE